MKCKESQIKYSQRKRVGEICSWSRERCLRLQIHKHTQRVSYWSLNEFNLGNKRREGTIKGEKYIYTAYAKHPVCGEMMKEIMSSYKDFNGFCKKGNKRKMEKRNTLSCGCLLAMDAATDQCCYHNIMRLSPLFCRKKDYCLLIYCSLHSANVKSTIIHEVTLIRCKNSECFWEYTCMYARVCAFSDPTFPYRSVVDDVAPYWRNTDASITNHSPSLKSICSQPWHYTGFLWQTL